MIGSPLPGDGAFNRSHSAPMNDRRSALLHAPNYSAVDAAQILGLPLSTVRNWSFGQLGRMQADQRTRFRSVIDPADRANRLLSFANLCDLQVLSAIRREHLVKLSAVRKGVDYVRKQTGKPRPLLDADFKTNGIDLFFEHAGALLAASREGQVAMRGEFERALARIEYDRSGAPVRLFPFSRARGADGPQPTVVAIDPTVAFGRPMLVPAGVKTEVIQSRFLAGDTPADMAEDFGVSADDVLEALRYEQLRAQAS